MGRQITKTDSLGTTEYVYDATGRILKVTMSGKTTIFAYDKVGNRQSLNETYTSLQPSGYTDLQIGEDILYAAKKSEYLYSNTHRLISLVEKMNDQDGKELLNKKTVTYLYD